MKVSPEDSPRPSTYPSVPLPKNVTREVSRLRWIWLILGIVEVCVGLVAIPIVTNPSLLDRYGYKDLLPVIFSAIGILVGTGIADILVAHYLPRRRNWKTAIAISLLHIAVGTTAFITIMQGWFVLLVPPTSIRIIGVLAYIVVGVVLLILLSRRRVRDYLEIHYTSKKKTIISICAIITVVTIPTFTIFYGYGYSTGIFAMQATYADRDHFESLYTWFIPEGADEWSITTDMPTPRDEPAAVVIENKIYVVGGRDASTFATDKVEVYDAKSNTWSEAKELPIALDHIGVASYHGKLYVVGGLTRDFRVSNALFIYDSHTNEWVHGKYMPTARGSVTAQFVDGILYAVGGWNGKPLRINEAYDPATDTWISKAPMPTARDHHASGVINGKMYVIGGRQGSLWTNVNVNEEYDPEKDEWSTKAPMPSYRGGITAVHLSDSIYVFGGENPVRTFDNNEQYIPSLDKWIIRENIPTARHGLTSAAVDGNIYIIGGSVTPGLFPGGKNEVFKPLDWRTSENDDP
jgi:N-acetylneuraminic acid mutarotase